MRLKNIHPESIANHLTPFVPTHPGEILDEELEERGVSRNQLAQQIGQPIAVIDGIIDRKEAVTTELALLFEAALGIDADFWLNMQSAYNKHVITSDAKFMKRLAEIRKVVAML